MPDPRLIFCGWLLILALVMWRGGASRFAVLGLVCLVLSTGLFNLWTLVEVPAWDDGPEAHVDALTWAYDLWALGLNAVLVLYLCVVVYLLCTGFEPDDLAAKLTWAIVLVAETYSLLAENFNCNVLNRGWPGWELSQVWGTEVSIYACARNYGEVVVWAPTVITALALTWVAYRSPIWKRGS